MTTLGKRFKCRSYKFSEEGKQRLRESRAATYQAKGTKPGSPKGRHTWTDEQKAKLQSRVPWNKGKKLQYNPHPRQRLYKPTAETRKKQSDAIVARILAGRTTTYAKGTFISVKCLSRFVGFRSSLEFEVMRRLDDHPDVLSWEYEPFRIDYVDENGSSRCTVPDFVVHIRKGIRVVEVKGFGFLKEFLSSRKNHAIASFCFSNGLQYQVLSLHNLSNL